MDEQKDFEEAADVVGDAFALLVAQIVNMCDAALAAPPRNNDAETADERT